MLLVLLCAVEVRMMVENSQTTEVKIVIVFNTIIGNESFSRRLDLDQSTASGRLLSDH